ncbi:hypothetical protein [Halorussus caseinilyticus]|uniref:PASTA domain-containing protein n=1 Tax=Halorussus caseinilyticus TaxID=3034025 RepID=A0ABD5WNC4_9EURY|nr:hypothetical protein [Halorussus sp. DT72]
MGYHVINSETVEPAPDRPYVQRSLRDAAKSANVTTDRYEVEPEDRRVETPDGERVVPEGHVFVVESDA